MADEIPIDSLLSLLDDDDEACARAAMSQLLMLGDRLPPILASLQESDNPMLRRRSHQLQSALTQYRRRESFHRFLEVHDNLRMIDGLVALHLLWFDHDSEIATIKLFEDFQQDFKPKSQNTFLDDLSRFFRKKQLIADGESTLDAERYTIGTILDNNYAAASAACALGCAIAQENGKVLLTGCALGHFVLLDQDKGKLLDPRDNYQVHPLPADPESFVIFPHAKLLKFIAEMVFSNAVNDDNFRYIHTLGQALAGTPAHEPLSFLPYPYGDE